MPRSQSSHSRDPTGSHHCCFEGYHHWPVWPTLPQKWGFGVPNAPLGPSLPRVLPPGEYDRRYRQGSCLLCWMPLWTKWCCLLPDYCGSCFEIWMCALYFVRCWWSLNDTGTVSYRSYDEDLLTEAVLQRCGSHSGILHVGTTPDAPVSRIDTFSSFFVIIAFTLGFVLSCDLI